MEPWMIDMLGSNAGGSHDLDMLGTNAGGSHDVEVAETQYASPQLEQVFIEAAVVEVSTAVKVIFCKQDNPRHLFDSLFCTK
ncbi:hypothetical protein GQ55_8G164300 [Panicum hallii var. hallii]|uniref:Uncharacterized protein n=1 Tax=Panicum hallii var. hallii TaxID=1504633 RepID=A0A2T7CNF5_9POAL|nr:hypothetical protein GQ55_8G164300 [Panicum hallii var. hallii]